MKRPHARRFAVGESLVRKAYSTLQEDSHSQDCSNDFVRKCAWPKSSPRTVLGLYVGVQSLHRRSNSITLFTRGDCSASSGQLIFETGIYARVRQFRMSSPEPVPRGVFAWLWRRPHRWFLLGIPAGGLVAFVAGIIFTGGFVGGLKLAETDAFCTSCHEMKQPYQELTRSVHFSNEFGIQASCGNCHVPPQFLPGLWRHIQAYAEVWGHMRGELNTPAKYEAHRMELAQKIWTELKANDSAECRSCHTPGAMAFAKQTPDAASAHQSLKQDGTTCIDCHQGVAHTLPQGG